jgi:hypothetical protein
LFGSYPTATLFWVNDTGSDDPVYVGLNNKNGSGDTISSLRVRDFSGDFASQYGLAEAADTFSRADNSDLGSTEVGSLDWTNSGMEISGNQLTNLGTDGVYAEFDPSVNEGIWEMTFTTPSTSMGWVAMYFRYKDSNNWWRVRCNSSQYWLEKSVGGSYSLVDTTGAFNCATNTTYRLVIRAHGSVINAYFNSSNPMFTDAGIVDSSLLGTSGATGVRIEFGSGNPSVVDNVAVYPKTISLPADAENFPTVPSSGTTTLISDSFTDGDATSLDTHSPETNIPGGSWIEHVGDWSINSNSVTPSSVPAYTTIETGQTDMSLSADFNLGNGPSNPSDWFNNLVGIWIDSNNYMVARFLWQEASPEIEFWDAVDGSTANFCATSLVGDVLENTTYNMEMNIVGKKVGIYLDGKLVLECFTSNLTGTRAGIGVDSLGLSTNSVDNFVVKTTADDSSPPPEVADLEAQETPTLVAPNLSWTEVIDDAKGTSFYRVYRSTSASSLGTQINSDNSTTSGSFIDSSLSSPGNYYYTVRAVDVAGNENTRDDNNQVAVSYGEMSIAATPLGPAAPPTCNDTTPLTAPNLYSASRESNSSIRLQFTGLTENVTTYAVEYGTETDNYKFAADNIGGKDASSYTVGSLEPNTTYFFRLRAGNGCATGPWSSEISASTYSGGPVDAITSLFDNDLGLEITDTEVAERQPQQDVYTVREGDTLYQIALDLLGDSAKYIDIIEANKEEYPSLETNPSSLEVGWELIIPQESEAEQGGRGDVSEQEGYTVQVKVVDLEQNPIGGARVELHSTPRVTTTDDDGIARFEDVEAGDHKIAIEYNGQRGEKDVTLTGDTIEEFNFTIQIEPTSPFKDSKVLMVIGGLGVVVIGLMAFVFVKVRN